MNHNNNTKKAASALFFLSLITLACPAQVNIQLLYDCVETPITTIETYKGDRWGDTYFFIDHYYFTHQSDGQRSWTDVESYYEFERGLNFWKNTRLRDLFLHLEFDFNSIGNGSGMTCIGARYAFHNADFSRTASVALMYDHFIGNGSADVPLKFTGTWNVGHLFGLGGLTFNGFFDVWGNNTEYLTDQMEIGYAHFSVVSQPQLWMNMSDIGVPNLNLGGEVVLGYNHRGTHGLSCQPCVGLKWVF